MKSAEETDDTVNISARSLKSPQNINASGIKTHLRRRSSVTKPVVDNMPASSADLISGEKIVHFLAASVDFKTEQS